MRRRRRRERRRGSLVRRPRAAIVSAALTALALSPLAIGCAGASHPPTPAALKLEREDLIATSQALLEMKAPVARAVAATKSAWPLIANGLPSQIDAVWSSAAVARAVESSAQLRLPALFSEVQARTLTGPASQIAGLFRSYCVLDARAWKLLHASLAQIRMAAPVATRFARENAPLYIESVYDAHFTLAQIGKKLRAGYRNLGGPRAFGAALTPQQVAELEAAYGEPSDRLHPHVGARLGS
ncbi:MAG: hypothetical protein QOF54_1701 [Solirubrobacteraceae bacterium]|jgi:hypothetical protein|nr:hypothetical protein [Solirubrobacteraceae bacterium]